MSEKSARELGKAVMARMECDYGRYIASMHFGQDISKMSADQALLWAEVGKQFEYPDECPECHRKYSEEK